MQKIIPLTVSLLPLAWYYLLKVYRALADPEMVVPEMTACTHCDNCQHPPGSLGEVPMNVVTWELAHIINHLSLKNIQQTVNQLANMIKQINNADYPAILQDMEASNLSVGEGAKSMLTVKVCLTHVNNRSGLIIHNRS
jgi:hypothetical protein